MKEKTQNTVAIVYLVVLGVSLMLFIPIREWIDYNLVTSYSFYESFYLYVSLAFSAIGAILVKFVVFREEGIGWWMTFWCFVILLLILFLIFGGMQLLHDHVSIH